MITKKQLQNIATILPYYCSSVDNSNVTPLGDGLINETYLVESPKQSFVLQRINLHVFPEPELIASNAALIHKHLSEQIIQKKYHFASIGHINNNQGNPLTFVNDECWRAIDYIPESKTVNTIDSAEKARQVADAFATFTASLNDFDAEMLKETIPNFHCINSRIEQLNNAIENTSAVRLNEVNSFVIAIKSNQVFIEQVNKISAQLPIRVTHNDTKINNLLFSKKTNQPKAVIDLDTCMPGFLMNDFGDLIRTTCPTIDENKKNINEMEIRLDVFETIAQSYIKAFKHCGITKIEKDSLVIGAQLLPFMLAIRFLTDYLNNDIYFHIDYKKHNLDRAANQLHLFTLLREKNTELLALVHQ